MLGEWNMLFDIRDRAVPELFKRIGPVDINRADLSSI
jgi:hypothetical protein